MRNVFIFFLLVLILFSCNKTVKRDQLLQGNWELKKITVFDYDGLSYSTDTSCSGELTIKKELDTSFSYQLKYSMLPFFNDSTIAKGSYVLKDDAEYFTHTFLSVSNSNIIPGNHSRILFLSDSYFKWEYIDNQGIKQHLIFEKRP